MCQCPSRRRGAPARAAQVLPASAFQVARRLWSQAAKTLMKRVALVWVLLCGSPVLAGGPIWRQATPTELRQIIPARAPVGKERIETEFRSASGISDGRRFIAGVVMITAGYEAEGKYSHFFITQLSLRIGDMLLPPG